MLLFDKTQRQHSQVFFAGLIVGVVVLLSALYLVSFYAANDNYGL